VTDPTLQKTLATLRKKAAELAPRVLAPFSDRRETAVLLLSDGTLVPGVRVESATFSLVIPAPLAALTIATANGRRDFRAMVLSYTASEADAALIAGAFSGPFRTVGPDAFLGGDGEALPAPGEFLYPFLTFSGTTTTDEGLGWARKVARRAYVPESDFPVGAIFETADGRLLPGVNVEHPDWSRILCAERTALATVATYDAFPVRRVFVSCVKDPGGTPCGACRQLLAEYCQGVEVFIDHGEGEAPTLTTPEAMLPGSFTGIRLLRAGARA
jgi:cytidine deaminase